MRVSRQKAAENRERIIDVAGALFREKGFDGIGVADIMKAAQLTHGGFYGHFASKDDLVAQASQRAMARAAAKWERIAAGSPKDAYEALLANYLTPTHRDDPARGCAFASAQLRCGARRQGRPRSIRGRLAALPRHSCRGRSGALEGGAPAQGGRHHGGAGRGRRAGPRAVGDQRLSDEILDAVHRQLLETRERLSARGGRPAGCPRFYPFCSLNVLAGVADLRYCASRAGSDMVERVSTVAFEGIEARPVDVQVQIARMPAFTVVGLGDKAVANRANGCAPR